MKILIYGANGYLGSHLVNCFVNAGHQVTGFVRSDAAAAQLRDCGAAAIIGDLTLREEAVSHCSSFDAVIFAAQLLLMDERHTVNAILDQLEGSNKTFIFTSGTGVLSERTDGKWSDLTYTDYENIVPSKYIGERHVTETIVRVACNRGIRTIVFRPPLIWGNGGTLTIQMLYISAAKTGAVCYLGSGQSLYSNVHAEDVAEAYRLSLEKGQPGALYHCVSGEENNRSLALAVARSLNLPTRSIDMDEAITLWDKFGALITMGACSRSRSPRCRDELGWRPNPDHLDIFDDIDHPNYLAAYEQAKQ